jgi:hypothetical protein
MGLPYMDAALIGKGRMRARILKRRLAGDVAFQLFDMLGLVLDHGFDQIAD